MALEPALACAGALLLAVDRHRRQPRPDDRAARRRRERRRAARLRSARSSGAWRDGAPLARARPAATSRSRSARAGIVNAAGLGAQARGARDRTASRRPRSRRSACAKGRYFALAGKRAVHAPDLPDAGRRRPGRAPHAGPRRPGPVRPRRANGSRPTRRSTTRVDPRAAAALRGRRSGATGRGCPTGALQPGLQPACDPRSSGPGEPAADFMIAGPARARRAPAWCSCSASSRPA